MPQRIVSLLPSATELICFLGLEEQLVGVTHECDYPESVQRLPKVTKTLIPTDVSSREIDRLVREQMGSGPGEIATQFSEPLPPTRALYRLDFPELERLKPDLIVTQTLCDVCAVAEAEVREAACSLVGIPKIVNLEPVRLEDLYHNLRQVAEAADCLPQAEKKIVELQSRVLKLIERNSSSLAAHISSETKPRVVLLEWIDPLFCSGHWNPEIVSIAGGQEMIGSPGARSRTISFQEIMEAKPEVMVISCCGYSMDRAAKDLEILQSNPGYDDLPCSRNGRVYLVDGSAYFSRPGPRLIDSAELIAHILFPERNPLSETITKPKVVR